MSSFKDITNKLEIFIKKYYTNALLKGCILFFGIGLMYLLFTLFVEHLLWLSPNYRTLLFWVFVIVEVCLLVNFIAFPLLQLFKLRKGIDYKTASQLIGNHFPKVNDKLLNLLQLSEYKAQSELLLASIEQKSKALKPIPFQLAINFKHNYKYLKYALLPVLIVVVSFLFGNTTWFSESYKRVVDYKTAYEPPAPFQFFVLNSTLQTVENEDFTVFVSTIGNFLPENPQIHFNNQSFFLKPTATDKFQYTFKLPKQAIEFTLSANQVQSKTYTLNVLRTPNLLELQMVLNYPNYTKKQSEILKSTGSAIVPEGTKVTWKVNTKHTSKVQLYANDTINFVKQTPNHFYVYKQLFNNYNYSISTSNQQLLDYENLAYSINVVKDQHPKLNVEVKKDSIDEQSLYFYGQAADDYGLSKLQLVYYPANNEASKQKVSIPVSKTTVSEFIAAFPNTLNIQEGVSYKLYFEVFDNDAIHNNKSTKSTVFSYRKRTNAEEEQRQLNLQNQTINSINSTFEKLKKQDKDLDAFSKLQKEKEQLNFNDQQRFKEFIKRQKEQEQLMKNFNKKLQDNLEEFQNNKKEDQFKEDLKQRLKENEAQLKQDEKLLDELEKIKDKINKEQFANKLEELAKQNKNKQRSMKQLLEITKRFYVMKKAEQLMNKLDSLSAKQAKLADQPKDNTPKTQEQLNKEFEAIQKELDSLNKDNQKLQKPMNLQRDTPLEDSIKKDQQQAKEALQQNEETQQENQESQNNQEQNSNQTQPQNQKQNAKRNQKKAAKKMKEMSQMLMPLTGGGGGGDQMAEDIEMLRQILDNLLRYSFDQEALMNTFNSITTNHNKYGKYVVSQSNLRSHFEHIDDSLFALSLRQPKISEQINKQITNVYFNIDKALSQLTENRLYQGVSAQQYAVTSSNELASFLSDVLDNMEAQMNPSMGSGSSSGQQLPDLIMSQEQLNQMMEQGLKQQQEGKQGQQGKDGMEQSEGEGSQNKDNSKQQSAEGSNGNQSSDEQGQEGKDGKQSSNNSLSEEQSKWLYEIYQKQQQLRQALEDKIAKNKSINTASELIKQMEQVEGDLLNKGFTNQTLQLMMDIKHQLLKLEQAAFTQGKDNKRQSNTNKKHFNSGNTNTINQAKKYFNTTEILNRQQLPLQNKIKQKVKQYFNNN